MRFLRCLTHNLLAALVLFAGLVYAGQHQPHVDQGDKPVPASVQRMHDKIDRLVSSGACWTGEAPADVEIPGSVLVREYDANGAPHAYREDHLVSDAFEQIFDGVDHGLDIVAFCR